jgi:hypothetical protein
MASDTFSVGDLTAIIGDNDAQDKHRAGYNGLWSLIHRSEPSSIFVPGVAGMNLEHIFDGETLDNKAETKLFFEPRLAKMTFKKISDSEAELHQPATPTFHLESWTRFTLKKPHYIDFSVRFQATQHVFKRNYIGLFWASYINAPDDKSIYFRGKSNWLQHCTPTHNTLSSVVHEQDKFDLTFVEGHRDCLYKNISPLKFELPFYYGLFKNQTLILMFDRAEGIRFAHSPSGGGGNAESQTTNPAWDFQYILPKYEVMKEYSFRARLVYREKCSRTEVMREYEEWKKMLDSK